MAKTQAELAAMLEDPRWGKDPEFMHEARAAWEPVLRDAMASREYQTDSTLRGEVEASWRALYPDQIATAPSGPGEVPRGLIKPGEAA